jgi:diguanylate cyclase (GGDEF)-like protein/PAS domain S-box-containing protein
VTSRVTTPKPRPSSQERDWVHGAFQGLPVGVVVVDSRGNVQFCNPAARDLLEVGPGRFDPYAGGDLVREDGSPCLVEDEPVSRALTRGEVSNGVLLGRRKASGSRWLLVHACPLRDRGQSRPYGAAATFVDVTDAHERERAVHDSERMLRSLADHTSDWVARISPDLLLLSSSSGGGRTTGRPTEEWLGKPLWEWLHEEDHESVRAQVELLRAGADLTQITTKLIHQEGSDLWIETVLQAIRDERGELVEIQGTAHDITERVAHEAHLKRLAATDTLTGLGNRAAALEWLGRGQAKGARIAVLYLDVDRFKVVNDCLGHAVGDRLLVQIASRLEQVVKEGDLLARLGGDEFVLLREDLSEADALGLANQLTGALECPMQVDGHPLAVSASIGIVTGPVAGEPYGLLREADAAMYDAKERGRARAVVYTSDLGARAERRLRVETGLRAALGEGSVVSYYQPIVDLRSGRLVGVESLVRWLDPIAGILPPAEFLAVAEDSALIIQLGRSVVSQALHQLNWWRAQLPGAADLELAVNLSGPELSWEDTVPWLLGLLDDTGLAPGAVTIEVLESTLLSDAPILEAVQRLRAAGLRIGLDDFGTGSSSLTNLRRVPADFVKIDSSFVGGIGRNAQDEAIVLAVRDLAASFHADVLAEGVETLEQADWLRDRGVPYAQGFLFGRPQPAARLTELLTAAGLSPGAR